MVTARQLDPEEEQVVGPEVQEPRVLDPIRIAQPEKRVVPLPVAERAPLPAPALIAEHEAAQLLFGVPILKTSRYAGGDRGWQPLVRWDIRQGRTGDLHEIALLSDNDSLTRYRIVIGNIDQNHPTDRQTSTPVSYTWHRGVIPGGTSVYVEVMSTDGTSINVDAAITGTER